MCPFEPTPGDQHQPGVFSDCVERLSALLPEIEESIGRFDEAFCASIFRGGCQHRHGGLHDPIDEPAAQCIDGVPFLYAEVQAAKQPIDLAEADSLETLFQQPDDGTGYVSSVFHNLLGQTAATISRKSVDRYTIEARNNRKAAEFDL